MSLKWEEIYNRIEALESFGLKDVFYVFLRETDSMYITQTYVTTKRGDTPTNTSALSQTGIFDVHHLHEA